MVETNNIDREQWLDVAKFLGIIAVFVGHFGALAGGSYPFVYLYHNALFFFCSGYLHSRKHDEKFSAFFVRKCKHLLLPSIAFSLLVLMASLFFQIITGTFNSTIIKNDIYSILLLKGCGTGIWFFTGLLSVSVVFEGMSRVLDRICGKNLGGHNRSAILIATCLVMWCVPDSCIENLQFCNLGSAFKFCFYYALGNWFYVSIKPKIEECKNKKWIHAIGCSVLLLSVYFYCLCLQNKTIIPIIPTVIIILANLYLAKMLENMSLLAKWGHYTMYCCGNEYIIRRVFDRTIQLSHWLSNKIILEIACWLIALLFVVMVVYIVYPVEHCVVKRFKTNGNICEEKIT